MIRGEATYHFRVNPVLFQVPIEQRSWQSAINDITMPSPHETTLKRWVDRGGKAPIRATAGKMMKHAKQKSEPEESDKNFLLTAIPLEACDRV